MSSRILVGDCRERLSELPDQSVHCVVTSPPYFGLRSYSGGPAEIGLEPSLAEYIDTLVTVFRDVRRVMRTDATLWLNIGSSYGNDKCDLMVPARVALALISDAWILRSDIIWAKPNAMPESVTDRPTSAHEHVFLLAKSRRYFYDADAVRTDPRQDFRGPGLRSGYAPPVQVAHSGNRHAHNGKHKQRGHSRRHDGFNGRWDNMPRHEQMANGANLRNVWTIPTQGFPGSHFATFPELLARTCILAGCPPGGTVLDPFLGSGTTLLVADKLGRDGIGIELNPEYAAMAKERIHGGAPMFADVALA